MSDHERTGVRDLAFSGWHRAALSADCTAIDLDFLEYCRRCRAPLALIEIAKGHHNTPKPTTVLRHLAERAQVPAWLVLYDIDPGGPHGLSPTFRLMRIWPSRKEFGSQPQEKVVAWFEQLHGQCDCLARASPAPQRSDAS